MSIGQRLVLVPFSPSVHALIGRDGTQNLHLFFAGFPFLFMQPQGTVALLFWGAVADWQRVLLFDLPPTPRMLTIAGAFLPCLRWTPRQVSGLILVAAVWQADTGEEGELAAALSKKQRSSNLQSFFEQELQAGVPSELVLHAWGFFLASAPVARHKQHCLWRFLLPS